MRAVLDNFLERINNGSIKSPFIEIQKIVEIHPHLFRYFISSVPELLLQSIMEESKQYKGLSIPWNLDSLNSLSSIKDTLNCHALSPMGDSIFLLSDLGRSLRITAALDKKLNILLADDEWSRFNWVVQDLGDENLSRNLVWRSELYNTLGCSVEKCNLNNTGIINKEQIERIAFEFEDLAKGIFGKEIIGKELDSNEAKELVRNLKLFSQSNPGLDLFSLKIISEKLKPEKKIIKTNIEYLRKLDKKTFTYYLTQRFHQYKYKNFLKLAVRSERNFDLPFHELDKFEKTNEGISSALYFDDYVLESEETRRKFVIPYYFPSGSLYEKKELYQEYRKEVILLEDFDKREKFLKIFSEMPYPHNARFSSDFLSFVHFFIYKINGTQQSRAIKNEFKSIVKEYSEEFYNSWNFYCRPKAEFHKKLMIWADYLFTSWPTEPPVPYYFQPYLLLLNDTGKNDLANFMFILFKKMGEHLKFPTNYKHYGE